MPFIVVKDTDACPVSRPWAVYTETGHQTGKKTGKPHGCHPTADAARQQQKALYANVDEASRSAAPPPPNLRVAELGPERCGTCHMFDAVTNQCWGYGNYSVEPNWVCDNFYPETEVKSTGEDQMGTTVETTPRLEPVPDSVEWRQSRAQELSDIQRKRMEPRVVSAPLELRDEVRVVTEDGSERRIRTLRSYGSLFDESNLYSVGSRGYRFDEWVKRGAFKRNLAQNPDIVFRWDHGGAPLGRSINYQGKPPTMRVGEDEIGLWYEVDLDMADPDARSLANKIDRGDLSESSIAFRCVRDTWNEDFTIRCLEDCTLDRGDISVVTFGASRATGKHLLLRSEEALQALREIGEDQFLEAWTEWRDFTCQPLEERAGKTLSSTSMQVLTQVLGLISDADERLDDAQPLLASLMGVPNPDIGDTGTPDSDEDVTSSEQLDHTGRSETRAEDAVHKPTIAIDFDGVIHQGPHGMPGEVEGEPIEGTQEALSALHDQYHTVILTARQDFPAIRSWLEKNDMSDSIDDVTNVKPNAIAYIDDRGIHFTNWPDTLKAADPNLATNQPVVTLKRSAEILVELRATKSPLVGDHVRTTPHLLDTVLSDLAHSQQHASRLFDPEVQKNSDSQQFNAEHLQNHLNSAQEHAHKLDTHLQAHPSDPDVYRSEREVINSQRTETPAPETRDDPTDADYGVMSGLQNLKMMLAAVKGCQLTDPDGDTDSDDQDVMAALEGAEAQIDAAIVAQAKDGRYDPEEEDDDEDRSATSGSQSAKELWDAVRELGAQSGWKLRGDGTGGTELYYFEKDETSETERAEPSPEETLTTGLEQIRTSFSELLQKRESDSEPQASEEVWGLVEAAQQLLPAVPETSPEVPTAERSEETVEVYWDTEEWRRTFTSAEREKLAKSGAAMPGGEFPIANTADLKNAIQAVGRAKDPTEAKAHIKKRAKALGATNLIPDSWRSAELVDNDSDELMYNFRSQLFLGH